MSAFTPCAAAPFLRVVLLLKRVVQQLQGGGSALRHRRHRRLAQALQLAHHWHV